ncbi:MAG: hypothetical protein ACLFNC_02740 [Halodesulfurarchaeum sp.]
MFESPWEIGFIVGIAGLYALFLYQFARKRLSGSAPTPAPNPDPGDEPRVVCPECGTRNAFGYRYCRSCIAELPQTVDSDRGGGHRLSRNAR